MRRSLHRSPLALVVVLIACSSAGPEATKSPSTPTVDAGTPDSSGTDVDSGSLDANAPLTDAADSGAADAGDDGDAGTGCSWGGAPGECMTLPACAAIANHTSFSGECPGPASIECCITTPNTTDNPPTPAGYELMQQSQVTAAMTTWAVAILNDPTTYPMFSTTTMTFGTLTVLARVEWHPPDFQNSVVHRGVTLYEPI